MNVQVKEQTADWKKCCDIIEKLENAGDSTILADCIRMCCANSEEVMNCVIGQYEEDVFGDVITFVLDDKIEDCPEHKEAYDNKCYDCYWFDYCLGVREDKW